MGMQNTLLSPEASWLYALCLHRGFSIDAEDTVVTPSFAFPLHVKHAS